MGEGESGMGANLLYNRPDEGKIYLKKVNGGNC